MAKTWHFDHYELNAEDEFLHIGEITTNVKKDGYHKIPYQELAGRKVFNVVKELDTGFMYVDRFSGSLHDARRLKTFVITGIDPTHIDGSEASEFHVLMNSEDPFSQTVLLKSENKMTLHEWRCMIEEAKENYAAIEKMTPMLRFQMPKSNQAAFGFGKFFYARHYLGTRGFIEIQARTQGV